MAHVLSFVLQPYRRRNDEQLAVSLSNNAALYRINMLAYCCGVLNTKIFAINLMLLAITDFQMYSNESVTKRPGFTSWILFRVLNMKLWILSIAAIVWVKPLFNSAMTF